MLFCVCQDHPEVVCLELCESESGGSVWGDGEERFPRVSQ